jgi:Ca2+-binding RTX toxin-like protein
MSFQISKLATPVTRAISSSTTDAVMDVTSSTGAVELIPPVYYEASRNRIEIFDNAGKLVGYDDQVSGFGYSSITHYDVDFNYIGSEYKSMDGGYWSTVREAIKNTDGKITGYVETSMGGHDDYTYSSTAEYDSSWNNVSSSYKDSSGYQSSSTQTITYAADGSVASYDYSATSGDASYSTASNSHYDGNWNLISAQYQDTFGYTSSSQRTVSYDENGKVSGYVLESQGENTATGYSYKSSEHYGASYDLQMSDYSDSSGYTSTYLSEILVDATGVTTGYRFTSTWSYGTENQKSVQEYDAMWNLVYSDFPQKVVDEGPVEMPVQVLNVQPIVLLSKAQEGSEGSETDSAKTHVKNSSKAEKLAGQSGDDIYHLNNRNDKVVDHGKTGTDSITSSGFDINLSKSNYVGIENASLLGSENLSIYGNSKVNHISGNSAANKLNGKGGNDVIFGGIGSDAFIFNTALNAKKNVDTISDFELGVDKIALDHHVFRAFKAAGAEIGNGFGDHFVYDTVSGVLSYDPDGSGHKAPIAFVTLTGAPGLTVADLEII